MMCQRSTLTCVAAALLLCSVAFAEDMYFELRISSMKFIDGALPVPSELSEARSLEILPALEPYAVLDGEGEAYVGRDSSESRSPSDRPFQNRVIFIRAPKDKEVTGHLFIAKPDFTRMVHLKFKVDTVTATPGSEKEFLETKDSHYRRLLERNIPGGAWFRHLQKEAAKARGAQPVDRTGNPTGVNRRPLSDQPEDTYGLFSGGRAISENLQLDRVMAVAKSGESTVEVSTIAGITTREMDWKPLLTDPKPAVDPLAAYIPSDQHAIFFPTFSAVTEMMDEADADGSPVLQLMEPRSEDANSRGRYQKQLCLELNEISRLLGPRVIGSVAVTGSDPYLRTGTDVGVLFETKSSGILKTFVMASQSAAKQSNSAVRAVSGELEGVAYSGVLSPDRAVSSYVAALDDAVFVSNSLYQLGCLLNVAKGKRQSLAAQDEYVFFRSRYARGEKNETALLILSDAAIRRWCGPQWRIANSRRTRVAAVLAELQATHLDALANGQVKPGLLHTDFSLPEMGELSLTSAGVISSTYGTLEFLTPISEMALTKVSKEEAAAYNRWRDGYQENWRQFFDPIAVRFSVQPRQLSAELTVMPLIAGTDYSQFIGLTRGAKIAPESGDRHSEALMHLALSINTQSDMVKQTGNFLGMASPSLRANPLGWLGQSVAIYADKDSFWDNLLKTEKGSDFLQKNYSQIPLALHCEVKDSLALAAFLAALRGYIEQTAPKLTTWQNSEYNGQSFVKIAAAGGTVDEEGWGRMAIYYAVTPKSLVVTPNETLLKRTLDRQLARTAGKQEDKPASSPFKPWLGTNLCLQVDSRFVAAIETIARDSYQSAQQLLSWNNLPILNEWKWRYPSEDPLKLHERTWKTKLICPSGGTYVWNEQWHTMESTIYGHPGEPKKGPDKIAPLARITSANFGVTFEHQGLSARGVLERESK